MATPRTFVKRIYLDTIFNRATQDTNNWIGSTVKAFRVLSTNNAAFDLSIVADPDNGSIQGIPLKFVKLHNYSTIANNAVLENTIVQAGVYVDLLISVQDELTYTGEAASGGSSVVVSEGTNFSHSKVTLPINGVVTSLVAADSSRAVAVIQLKSGGVFYVGNPTDLANSDFRNICTEIILAPGGTFEWRNAAALSAKNESVDIPVVVSVMLETK